MNARVQRWLFWGALSVELLLFIAWQCTHLGGFQWTTDEGLYVMRVRLLQQGYALYRDIWTDQLPGMVQLVRLAFALGGAQIAVARAAVVLSASVGLLSSALVARRLSGDVAALLVTPLIAIVPNYYWLSRAVVSPDLPATSLAVAALALLAAYVADRKRGFLLASGVVMAAALYVKASALLVAAPCLVWLWHARTDWRSLWRDYSIWGLAVALPLLLALAVQHPVAMWQQFVATQLVSAALELKIGAHAVKIGAYLLENWGLTALALCGLAIAVLKKHWSLPIVGSWLGAALLVLLVRSPMWPKHHLSVLLYPLGIVAVVAVEALAKAARERKVGLSAVLGLIGVLAQLAAAPTIIRADAALAAAPTYESTLAAVSFLQERYPQGTVVIGDYHMIPFRAGATVPPALATVTKKRLQLGLLSTEALVQSAQDSQVQAILLWDEQLESSTAFTSWAREQYALAFKWSYHEILCLPAPGEVLYAANVALGPALRLERYGVRRLAADPGGELEIVLYWRVLAEPEQKLYGFVHVVDDAGNLIAQQDQLAFGESHDSTAWRAGELIEDRYRIAIPNDAPSGQYRFSVGLYDADDGQRVQAVAGDSGEGLGGQIILQPRPVVRWARVTTPPDTSTAVAYRFGAVGELVGWSQRQAASSLQLALAWRGLTPPLATEYVVFAHLRQDGELAAQRDGSPANGARPTTGWREGEYILDERTIGTAELAPGTYDLYVGLYDPSGGQRVPVADAAGAALPGDEVCLGQVVISP